ncbi:MAG TPA: TonB-dependent receptor [Paludibacter sp.]|nr:TonB-dependent receptor [Paludibacter sp.]
MKYIHFKLKLRAFVAVLAMLVFGLSANAQQTSVSGIVKDAKTGETILGASVLEKGTSKGVITNIDGAFTISVPSNATLVVRYLGYLSVEVPVAGKTNFTIQLHEDAISLGEVVAIGYATVKKNDATGSITAIKPDKLNKGLTTNAQDMIVGKIAGVVVTNDGGAPGSKATIRIRGGSSLNASNDPLIVIDGLAMDNEGIKGVANLLSTINPNDIESFTVLKDASATAIYGSRASNGVILITTKKGEKGSKPHVSYDGNMSVGVVGKTIDVMSGDQFRAYANQLYAGQTGVLSKLGTANTDWQSQIYQTAISHDHNVSIMGGLKNMPYRASFGYTNQDGVIKTSNFERYTGSVSLNPSFFDDHLKVSLNAKGLYAKTRYADTGAIGSAVSMDPTQSVTSTQEPYKSTFAGYWQWITSGTTWNSLSVANPLATLNLKRDIAHSRDFIGNAEFDYKVHFLPELRAHLSLGTEISEGQQDLAIPTTNASDGQLGRTGFEKIYKYNRSLSYYMDYAKELGAQKFDVMAGYEWQHFYRSKNNKYSALDLTTNRTTDVFKTESYLVSFFGRANYTLLDRYLLTATIRNDGSSRFASGNRWGLFPSVAFAWKINEESFMKGNTTFSDLKLRLGYGITGQQNLGSDIGDYPYFPVYITNIEGAAYPIDGSYIQTYRPNPYNKKLKWETTTTYNAGLDWGLLNNRITGSIDGYYRVTDNLISRVNVAAGTNFSNIVTQNIGSLENKGVEFTLTGKPVSTKDFTWDISYNATYNNNKITKLTGTGANTAETNRGISSGTGNYVEYQQVDFPAYSYYVYQQVYDANHKPIEGLYVDRNGDGKINDADRYYYHNPAPDVTMGLSSKLVYKEFDFGFSMRASLGNYVYNDVASNKANVGASGVWSTSGFFVNKPTSALETNFVGKTNWYFSDYYVQNASFVRVDNITVGYTFKNLFHVISSGRLSATVQNPFVITKYKGLDPEVFDGRDNNIYPRPIMTVIGLSLNF